jgi:DNA-binding IclR family transcriptional regulator
VIGALSLCGPVARPGSRVSRAYGRLLLDAAARLSAFPG